jgi:UMP-CMP kinase
MKSNRPLPQVVFVMGGPGAGKGTQCRLLLSKFKHLDSFSTGDLLRAKVKENSREAKALKLKMAKGELVSSETVVDLMGEYMRRSRKNIFLADGFPRSQDNIDAWNAKFKDKAEVKFLLLFDLPPKVMLKRLLGRASTAKVKRADDKKDVMVRRINTYRKSLPIFE